MSKIPTIFYNYIFNNELYVNEVDWLKLKNDFSQEFLISELSRTLDEYNIKLPMRHIIKHDAVSDFLSLKESNHLLFGEEWGSKFDYKYPFTNTYVGLSNAGNKSSDYFHQEERWKCDATGYPSPHKTWTTEKFRLTLFKALFSLNIKEINPTTLRNIISLRKYIAAQFRPSAAKAIYEHFNANTVLDFSMGWGDRLAGAYASNCVSKYVGIDPNKNLHEGYKKQIELYASIDGAKDFVTHCGCAEDESIITDDEYDMVFTSPPYFDKEKYSQDQDQSYIKYKGFDTWMNDFLNKSIELRTRTLKKGGHLIINISDIYTRKKQYNICDRMNDFIASTNKFTYIGAYGLRMPKRPMSKSSKNVGIYGEPIWIWQKIT